MSTKVATVSSEANSHSAIRIHDHKCPYDASAQDSFMLQLA